MNTITHTTNSAAAEEPAAAAPVAAAAPSPIATAAADSPAAPPASTARKPRIAVVTMGVKLGDETRGYTRFRFIAELLAQEGFDVDLITSSFQHWNKAHRDTSRACYQGLSYRIVFIDEPGYKRNLDLARIRSHAQAARNLHEHFQASFAANPRAYDLIYAEIPPNDVARACAEEARDHGIPFVADINDLWPEAMRMVVDIPLISDVAFRPFERDARQVYSLMSAAVGTSNEYAEFPARYRSEPFERITVYVGNDLRAFDEGARRREQEVVKHRSELWVTYAGTLGASYDIDSLIRAAALLQTETKQQGLTKDVRVKILGDGPDREKLERLAAKLDAPVDFLGYTEYDLMAAYLCASDVVVNSLKATAVQSIVTKIGDYLASGTPIVNTGTSEEFRSLINAYSVGINVPPEDIRALSDAISTLAHDTKRRAETGRRARHLAETQFDQRHAYLRIVDLVRNLL